MAAFVTLSFSTLLFLFVVVGYAQLSPDFYAQSCPRALSTIRRTIEDVVDSEPRMGASLLRLHFHDCFVNASEENFSAHSFYLGKSFTTDLGSMNGCDASVCLDDNATFTGEKTALPNAHSLRGFDVIDLIKSRVEDLCPRVVSCADILAVAARDSVVALGGPTWPVALGRRDSVTANLTAANTDLPAPSFDLPAIIAAFAKKGLSVTDMVALSGAHTIGQARCTTFRTRIYNETNIDPTYALSLKRECPPRLDDDNLSHLDVCTPEVFDNAYYKNLQNLKGLLHSDQQLYNNGSTDSLVNCYSTDSAAFLDAFVSAMIKMGNISPLTGTNGIIRSNCSKAS